MLPIDTVIQLQNIGRDGDISAFFAAVHTHRKDGDALDALQQGLDMRPGNVDTTTLNCYIKEAGNSSLQQLLHLAVATEAANPSPEALHRLGKDSLVDVFYAAADRLKSDKIAIYHMQNGVDDIDFPATSSAADFITQKVKNQKKSIIRAVLFD